MARELSETWSPPWAPHVEGKYEADEVVDGRREPQLVVMTCAKCKGTHRRTCDSGRVRAHIATFATLHLHRDPLADAPKTRGGRR